MKKIGCAALFSFLLMQTLAHAEIAVIPYKINNPSTWFPESAGTDYSRLITVCAMVTRVVALSSPRDVELDLQRLGIDPQATITAGQLELLGKGLRIDTLVLGKLSFMKNRYFSDSVVYSVKEGRVLYKARNEAASLQALAKRDTDELLVQYPVRKTDPVVASGLDIVFLLDLSAAMAKDWTAAKEAVLACSGAAIDRHGQGARVYIVPFSDNRSFLDSTVSENSMSSLRKSLAALKPFGAATAADLVAALRRTVNNITWRTGAKKMIIIIANSPLQGPSAVEQPGQLARRKNIPIFSLSCGGIPRERAELLQRLADISRGAHYRVAYHQRLFNTDAQAVDLYMENGRLYTSRLYERSWSGGLHQGRSGSSSAEQPLGSLSEIFNDKGGAKPTPYTLVEEYPRLGTERIINGEQLESNISQLLDRHVASRFSEGGSEGTSVAGKVLLGDGNISFWVTVPDTAMMQFFTARRNYGDSFYLGIRLRRDDAQAYDLAFEPAITTLGADEIPDILKVKPADMVKHKWRYLEEGMLHPPLWFIMVRVNEIESRVQSGDIRD